MSIISEIWLFLYEYQSKKHDDVILFETFHKNQEFQRN
jgi:hypothetical protein